MTDIIRVILTTSSDKHILLRELSAQGHRIDMYREYPELGGKNPIDFLNQYSKIREFSLEDLLNASLVNPNHTHISKGSIIDYCIKAAHYNHVCTLLWAGAKLSNESIVFAEQTVEILKLLNYRPGPSQNSIFEVASKRHCILTQIQDLMIDFSQTTAGEDSEPEPIDDIFPPYDRAASIAYRGVHFSKKYFSATARDKVKKIAKSGVKKATYSQSTLFDSGYDADDDHPETDRKIRATDKRNKDWVKVLQQSPDKKEKQIGSLAPTKTRNDRIFASLFDRFMQVYINSYSRLFNVGSIQVDFNFPTRNNPMISLSWNCTKANMYTLGNRFDQGLRSIYRDPHYRRSTKKPKHPNAGYIDIFAFTPEFIAANTIDRMALYQQNRIVLNSLYMSEEEVIVISLIPSEYHYKRCILSCPRLDLPFNKAYYAQYGIKSNKTLQKIKSLIFSTWTNSSEHLKKYNEGLKELTEKAAEGQALTIMAKMQPS